MQQDNKMRKIYRTTNWAAFNASLRPFRVSGSYLSAATVNVARKALYPMEQACDGLTNVRSALYART